MYRHSTEGGTPRKVGRLVPSRRSSQYSQFSQANDSGFLLPSTPLQSSSRLKHLHNSIMRSTPKHTKALSADPLRTVTKWRHKVKTPKRTYSKRSIHSTASITTYLNSSRKKRNVIPTYMANPTQAPKPTHKIELKKRHLIVDKQVAISPKTFKHQIESKENATNIKQYYANKKTEKKLKHVKLTAFDLLTNSNRPNLCQKLNKQFRAGCINKASSTYPKYKLLCTVPSLEMDDETRVFQKFSSIQIARSKKHQQQQQNEQQEQLNPSSSLINNKLILKFPKLNNNSPSSSIMTMNSAKPSNKVEFKPVSILKEFNQT